MLNMDFLTLEAVVLLWRHSFILHYKCVLKEKYTLKYGFKGIIKY